MRNSWVLAEQAVSVRDGKKACYPRLTITPRHKTKNGNWVSPRMSINGAMRQKLGLEATEVIYVRCFYDAMSDFVGFSFFHHAPEGPFTTLRRGQGPRKNTLFGYARAICEVANLRETIKITDEELVDRREFPSGPQWLYALNRNNKEVK